MIPLRYPGAIRAELVDRPNRFLARVKLQRPAIDGRGRAREAGDVVEAQVPDPGRLTDLLIPGNEVWASPASGEKRRTAWALLLARSQTEPRCLVSVDTQMPMRLVQPLLQAGEIRGLGGPGWRIRQEVRVGGSRLDFSLETGPEHQPEQRILLEVKSATLVIDGIARFPDAPTVRGLRHVEELITVARSDRTRPRLRAALVFVVQREDALEVRPHPEIDPAFAAALARAEQSDVMLRAVSFAVNEQGFRYLGPLPVNTSG